MIERTEGHRKIWVDINKKLQHKVEKTTNRHYPDDDLLSAEKLDDRIGPVVKIPREYLYGRQPPGEYGIEKKILAIAELERDSAFLEKAPLITCLVPIENFGSRIVVIDGHHRARESGRFRDNNNRKLYDKLPCRVFTTKEMAQLLNQSGHRLNDEPYTVESLTQQLSTDVGIAEQKFTKRMPRYKHPNLLRGITTIPELVEKFREDKKAISETEEKTVYDLRGQIQKVGQGQY